MNTLNEWVHAIMSLQLAGYVDVDTLDEVAAIVNILNLSNIGFDLYVNIMNYTIRIIE